MKRLVSACLLFSAAHLIGACTVSGPLNTLNETRPPPPAMDRLVLFDPNVRVIFFSLDGPRVREPETAAVAARMAAGIADKMRDAGIRVVRFEPRTDSEKTAAEQLVKVHFAVGRAKTMHALPANVFGDQPAFPLPTVSRSTPYEVPAPAAAIAPDIADRYGARYGMMINVYDEQTSGGIKSLQVVAVLLAGSQAFQPTFTFANFSIIDLRDGTEVWSYTERSGTRDITTDDGIYTTLNNAVSAFAEQRNKRAGAPGS